MANLFYNLIVHTARDGTGTRGTTGIREAYGHSVLEWGSATLHGLPLSEHCENACRE